MAAGKSAIKEIDGLLLPMLADRPTYDAVQGGFGGGIACAKARWSGCIARQPISPSAAVQWNMNDHRQQMGQRGRVLLEAPAVLPTQ